jgi:hypothetical protein
MVMAALLRRDDRAAIFASSRCNTQEMLLAKKSPEA